MKTYTPFPIFNTPFVLCLFVLILTQHCGLSNYDRFAFSIQDGILHRGQNPFTILATGTPELGNPERSLDDKSIRLNSLCSKGYNSIVIDLKGVSKNGVEIDPKWIDSFLSLTTETRRRQLGILLRIDTQTSEEKGYAENLADALAASFPNSWDVIFWFDGEPGDRALNRFKKESVNLLTAGANKGDILVSDSPVNISRPALITENVTKLVKPAHHYLLPEDDPTVQMLEDYYKVGSSILPLEKSAGFTPLFDGQTYRGWTITGDPSGWRIRDNTFEWVEPGGGYLRTVDRYDDFILQLEWKIIQDGNSGVFIHAPLGGRSSRIGMEIQIMGDYGQKPHKNGAGAIYDVAAPRVNASNPSGEWNQMEILCQDSLLRIKINDEYVQEHNLDDNPEMRVRLRHGFIMLQDHGDPVSFRNIRIKEL